MRKPRYISAALTVVLSSLIVIGLSSSAAAQYFGRNKVQYEQFDFKILKTKHVDIYYYPSAEQAAVDAGRMVERWYTRYAKLFGQDLTGRQALILYANHPDFAQTNVIGGLIGEGTGGVTESLRRRIVLPLTGTYAENYHVIGHELVHAFQYSIVEKEQHGPMRGMNAPLWFVEGMSEYLSLGPDYPPTAMWLRDAVLHDKVPSLHDLSKSSEYFPYRWGHAFWAFVAGKWGDDVIPKLLIGLQRDDADSIFSRVLGMDEDSLSVLWKQAVKDAYAPVVTERTAPDSVGRPALAPGDRKEQVMNLAPTISPGGRWAAFISQRDLFSLDLYLADLHTGKIVRKILSANTNAHFDALQFTNSTGTWSPDSKQMAIPVVDKGDSKIAIVDVATGDVVDKFQPSGVEAVSSLAWSPDGGSLLFSGTHGGIGNLYLYDFATGSTTRLTDDRYAELQPSWSPDGRFIAYSTDNTPQTDLADLEYGPMRIVVMDMTDRSFRLIPHSNDGKQISPNFSSDGRSIYFAGEQDGFTDLFRYSLDSDSTEQLTEVATGVSGLTDLSPTLAVSRHTGELLFTVFNDAGYELRTMMPSNETPKQFAGVLSRLSDLAREKRPTAIQQMMAEPTVGLEAASEFDTTDYHPSLSLVYAGQAEIGVGVDRFGATVGGGASFLWADMLNNRLLGLVAQANGSLKDLGGEAFYMNQRHRWNWGVSAGHVPYVSAGIRTSIDTVQVNGQPQEAYREEFIRERVFDERASLIAEYPLNRNQRLEFSTGYSYIHYSSDADIATYVNGHLYSVDNQSRPAPSGLNLVHGSMAFVGDYSYFGFTSPIKGSRYRFEIQPTAGSLEYLTVLADYRTYFFANPVTFALRALHYGRYFGDSESDRLSQLYLGYETYVRGYPVGQVGTADCSGLDGNCPELDRLIGSRLGIFNAEVRLPLFGVSEYGLVNWSLLPTELVAFFDGGVAWTKNDRPTLKWAVHSNERVPVFSAGGAMRFNLFGYLIAQVYYAFPFQRPETTGQFGFLISPGW